MTFTCRSCGSDQMWPFIDLGEMPSANALVRPENVSTPDIVFPLRVVVCADCHLAQLDHTVAPDELFSDYVYFSSHAASWVDHARRYAEEATKRFGLSENSQVVEIASNDGYLLKHFIEKNIPALGVEPAANVADAARSAGVPTETAFFNAETAERLSAQGRMADLMCANNVLAHVPDINGFVAGFKVLLKETGVASFEFPHLLKLLEGVQFDTIYHEHFFYLSLEAVKSVVDRQGLMVFDVEELPTHGGSLRVWVCHKESDAEVSAAVDVILKTEQDAGLQKRETYAGFSNRCDKLRWDLTGFLDQARDDGKLVVGYGAAAKGATLINYCRLTTGEMAYVVDRNPTKQNRLLPQSRIPIYTPDRIRSDKPDYVVILPWNLADEIIDDMAFIRSWGGKFVIPSPTLRIVR